MPDTTITLTALRRVGPVVEAIREGRHIELTEHGHPIAVIIPIAGYRALIAYRDDHQEQQ